MISKVHDAAINPQLLKNRERTKEEALATGAAPDEQHDEDPATDEGEEERLLDKEADASHAPGDQDAALPQEGEAVTVSGGGVALKGAAGTAGSAKKSVTFADQQEAGVKAAPSDVVGPEGVQPTMLDAGATPGEGKGEAAAAQAPAKPAKVGEFPAVKADKVVRLKGTDVPFEQKQQ